MQTRAPQVRRWCAALALGCAACGAGDDAAPAVAPGSAGGGSGGEVSAPPMMPESTAPGAAVPAGGEGAPSSAGGEGLDPGRIENVTPAAGTPGPAAERAPATPSSGCGQLVLVSSGEQSIDVGGVSRTFLLDLPSGYDGSRPFPLVFAFHGATTSGDFFRSAFYGNLLSTLSDDAILVHPDALGDPTAWDNDADVPFFDAMFEELRATLCVDEARVFATGHSSGGFFTNTLGCQRGDVLRAIAPVAGGGPFTFGSNACQGEVAVWLAHGENDPMVPFETGVSSRDRWLEANGCSAESAAAEPEPCVEYSGCAEGLPVRWCVHQDAHDWPDFAPEGIAEFFLGL